MSSVPGSRRDPKFYELRHPIVGTGGEAYSSLLRFKFNPTLSGSGSNTQSVVATTTGLFSIGMLETDRVYSIEAFQIDRTLTGNSTLSIVTRSPAATLASNVDADSLTNAALPQGGRLLQNAAFPMVRLSTASDVGSLSVSLAADSLNVTGQFTLYVRQYPTDADVVDLSFSSYTTVA